MQRKRPPVPEAHSLLPHLATDRGSRGGFSLVVAGVTQSHVNPDDPTDLQLDYVRRIGCVIDAIAPASRPLRTLHLGSGGLTIARYIAATRPGSRQDAVELYREIVDTVLRELPLPSEADVTVRIGDARDVAEEMRTDNAGAFDLIVVDVFSGWVAPLHVATAEFMGVLAVLLAPEGVLIVNVLSQGDLNFARIETATVAASFDDLLVIARPAVLRGGVGNVVIVGSTAQLPAEAIRAAMVQAPYSPASLLSGSAVDQFTRRARPLLDARLPALALRRRWRSLGLAVLRRARRAAAPIRS